MTMASSANDPNTPPIMMLPFVFEVDMLDVDVAVKGVVLDW